MRASLLLLLPLLFGAPQDEDRRLLKGGRIALRAGRYEEAQRRLERLALRAPDRWPPRRYLLRLFLETGQAVRAEKLCRQYWTAHPKEESAQVGLARALLDQDRPEEALRLLKNVGSIGGRWERTRALLEMGGAAEAAKTLESFVDEYNRRRDELMKDDYLALTRGLRLYADLGGHAEIYKQVVRDAVPELLKADPRDPVVKTFAGECYAEKYNRAAAERAFREALEVNPNYAPALLGLGELSLESNAGRAASLAERALKVRPGYDRAFALQARAQLWGKNRAGARATLEAGLKHRPRSPTLHALLAALDHLEGQTASRDREIQAARAIDPKSPLPYWEIGRALIRTSWRWAEANLFLRRAAEDAPWFRPALVDYGLNCLRIGDEKTGAKILREVNRRDPFHVRVQNTVNLLDDFEKKFDLIAAPPFRIRLEKSERAWMEPFVRDLLRRAWKEMSARYAFTPPTPIWVEVFGHPDDFSVRTVGLPDDMGALGACFGRVVTTLSPRARNQVRRPFNWGAVLWHEMAHVFALELSRDRVPRWFTEGLATYEERLGRPGWGREIDLRILQARSQNRLGGVAGLEKGPHRNLLLELYHQGGLILRFIDEGHGFAAVRKLLEGYGKGRTTEDLFRSVLGLSIEDFDKRFFAWLDAHLARIRFRLPPRESAARLQDRFAAKKEASTAVLLTLALLENRDAAGAFAAAKEAIALEPKDPWCRAVYGRALYRRREVEEAIRELKGATRAGIDEYHVWMDLGNALLDERDPEGAVAAFGKARSCFPRMVEGENPYRRMNEAHVLLRNFRAAIEDLESLVEMDPVDFPNRLKAARLRAERGEWKEASRLLEDALWIETRSLELHRLLARGYRERGLFPSALKHLAIVLELLRADEPPDAARRRADTLVEIGKVHLRMGDKEKARGYAMDALRILPGHEAARRLYDRAGR